MDHGRICSNESELIVRTFVQNWSHYISLSSEGTEKDCLMLVDLLDKTRLSWKAAAAESQVYKKRTNMLENQLKDMKNANELLNDRLLHCQAEMNVLMTKYNHKESEIDEYKQKLEKAKTVLRNVSEQHDIEYLQSILNTSRSSPLKNNLNMAQSIENTTTSSGNIEPFRLTPGRSALPPIFDEENENYSNSEIDYDRTGDSLESSEDDNSRRASRKRRSRSVTAANRLIRFEEDIVGTGICPSKRSKNEVHEVFTTTTIKFDPTGARKPSGSVAIRRSMNRSMSESTLDEIVSKNHSNTPTTPVVSTLRSPQCLGSSWTNNLPIARRTHRVTTFRPIFEPCDVCNKRFGITAQNALRCIDCELRFHRACHTRAPMPCVPRVPIQKSTPKTRLTLKSYCIKSHPMIPPLIIHCVLALEKDRLNFEGIYRISRDENPKNNAKKGTKQINVAQTITPSKFGNKMVNSKSNLSSDFAVTKLYQDILNARIVPSMTAVETETICGCVKKFLKNLKDSLIPETSFEDFKQAAENDDDQVIVNLVLSLPPANRDTLAYLLTHFQNVAKEASHNKMPIDNLARVLAPTIVRYSAFVMASLESGQVVTRYQYMILLRLLKIRQEFWQRFIEENMTMIMYEKNKTQGSQKEFLTPISKSEPRRMRNKFATIGVQQDCSPLIQPLNINRQPFHFQDPIEFDDTH